MCECAGEIFIAIVGVAPWAQSTGVKLLFLLIKNWFFSWIHLSVQCILPITHQKVWVGHFLSSREAGLKKSNLGPSPTYLIYLVPSTRINRKFGRQYKRIAVFHAEISFGT